MKRVFLLLAVAVYSSVRIFGAGADDQYVGIYNLIQEADGLGANSSQAGAALSKYAEAEAALRNFHKQNPDWNPNVVDFRISYVTGKMAELRAKNPNVVVNQPVPKPGSGLTASFGPPPRSLNASNDAQINLLRDQVRQMQSDKLVLEAKLREALSAMPAAVDPRELTKAEEKINSLQKENDLLKLTLNQEKTRPGAPGDARALSEAQQALADANRKLSEQIERANTLALEKEALQNKVKTLLAGTPGANTNESPVLETTRKELAEANQQLGEQKALAARLTAEKETLQARLRDFEGASNLRAENELLKRELATLRTASAPSRATEQNQQTTKAQAEIAKLQSDKEILRLEKIALENRVKQLSAGNTSSNSGPVFSSRALGSSSSSPDAARLQQLEQERDDLQKKLAAANKELFGRNSKGAKAKIEDLETQMMNLRARLEVFEARQVPYSVEELALFKTPEPRLADPKAGRKSVRELPAGTTPLVIEARRFFAAKQYDKAEEKYLQVLKQDEKNVPALANLAAIQLERNELEEAEKNIRQAIALAPDDAYAYSILGYVKFRQQKYDDALDYLSRAAKLDPENAEIQNYLGITLSNKGMRGPAETALRKAIQLKPSYGGAHHNLAVVYATQQPPMLELARWHYQKALAAGQPHSEELEKMLEPTKTVEAGGGSK